jgi:hypothetical protein
VTEIERDGLVANRVREGIASIQRLACVRSYVTEENEQVTIKLYSLPSMQHARLNSGWVSAAAVSENTCSIAVGVPGMRLLDDVVFSAGSTGAFARLPEQFRPRGLYSVDHGRAYVLAPGIIDQIRSIVCMLGLRPTRGNIEVATAALARRHGHVASSMESGKRTWRQIDVFGLASTQVLGVHNCGSKNQHRQLLKFSKLRGIAEQLALLDGSPAFSDIVDCIGKARVPCYAPIGHCTVHLARIFLPSYTGYDRIETAPYTDKCIQTVYTMGSGASTLSV